MTTSQSPDVNGTRDTILGHREPESPVRPAPAPPTLAVTRYR